MPDQNSAPQGMDPTSLVLWWLQKIDKGIEQYHKDIAALRKERDSCKAECIGRIIVIEEHLHIDGAVEAAVEGIKKENVMVSRDWWKWFIRMTSGIIASWMLLDWMNRLGHHFGWIK